MPLFLTDKEQDRAIAMPEAIAAIDGAIRSYATGEAIRRPRIDSFVAAEQPGRFLNFSSVEGGLRGGYYALRLRSVMSDYLAKHADTQRETTLTGNAFRGLVLLFDTADAGLVCIMTDGYIQRLRVAATAALGIKYMARTDAATMGMYGTGGLARLFPLAAKVVRPIERIRIHNPNRESAQDYYAEMCDKLDMDVQLVDDPAQVCEGAAIVCACTDSRLPVMEARWIEPGTHLNSVSIGEFDREVMARIDAAGIFCRRQPLSIGTLSDTGFGLRNFVMSYATGPPEAAALIPTGLPHSDLELDDRAVVITDWESTETYADHRGPDEVTYLANMTNGMLEGDAGPSGGIQGLQFAAIGGRIYENARDQEIGFHLDLPS